MCVLDTIRCAYCTRILRSGLFESGSSYCNTCVRKRGVINSLPRGMYKTSVNNTFITRRILADSGAVDPLPYFQSLTPEIRRSLVDGIALHSTFRWTLETVVIFERPVEGILTETRFEFRSNSAILLRHDEIDSQIDQAIDRLVALITDMEERESDFVFKRVFSTLIRIARYNPVGGSSYIKTPQKDRKS